MSVASRVPPPRRGPRLDLVDRSGAGGAPGEDRRQRRTKVEEARATAVTKLPEAAARLAMAPPPSEDERIAVHVKAIWPDGSEEDRIVADGLFGSLSTFDFSATLGK